MPNKECIRSFIEEGLTRKEAKTKCRLLYRSKTTPEILYRSMVPGVKAVPGRLAYEKLLLKRQRKRRRRRFRGIPRG